MFVVFGGTMWRTSLIRIGLVATIIVLFAAGYRWRHFQETITPEGFAALVTELRAQRRPEDIVTRLGKPSRLRVMRAQGNPTFVIGYDYQIRRSYWADDCGSIDLWLEQPGVRVEAVGPVRCLW